MYPAAKKKTLPHAQGRGRLRRAVVILQSTPPAKKNTERLNGQIPKERSRSHHQTATQDNHPRDRTRNATPYPHWPNQMAFPKQALPRFSARIARFLLRAGGEGNGQRLGPCFSSLTRRGSDANCCPSGWGTRLQRRRATGEAATKTGCGHCERGPTKRRCAGPPGLGLEAPARHTRQGKGAQRQWMAQLGTRTRASIRAVQFVTQPAAHHGYPPPFLPQPPPPWHHSRPHQMPLCSL